MALNLGGARPISLVPDSPAVKRQKTTSGYNSTSNSASNTGAYNSENDDGDDLFESYVPDTPGNYQTQPTQIIDRSAAPHSSPPTTPKTVVQVPASSPFTGRDLDYVQISHHAVKKPVQNGVPPPKNLAISMAPAGTSFKPPHGIVKKPPQLKTIITIDDDSEDDGPKFQGGSSSDDEALASANIKPTLFTPKSAQTSFGDSPSGHSPITANGNAKFQAIVANATYKAPDKGKITSGSVYGGRNRDAATWSSIASTKPRPTAASMSGGFSNAKKPLQMRPERARPIEDISLNDIAEAKVRDSISQIRKILPTVSILTARNALMQCHYNWEDAIALLCTKEVQSDAFVISDDEIESPQPAKKPEPQMKRTLDGPAQSIRDKYSSTQALPPKKLTGIATPPPKPRKRLVKGRRNPSSPAIPAVSSPLKPQSLPQSPAAAYESYESDSGVASASEEDPELDGRVLKYLNTCKVEDLVELTNSTKEIAQVMIDARPFRSLDAARTVENTKPLKSGKKSTRAPVGDRIVETALNMFKGYEGIDTLVARCGELAKPLAAEMAKWGVDVFGAQKDGELEMTSLEDDAESQRDSGIGSPSSGTTSTNGDDDVKVVSSARKRNVQFLKKPDLMAQSTVLKDYQVVGLNWLALMYRHKLSCILADEMGLGKTCQVIAFLSHLVETGINGPHLVVCPGSTLENWLREFQRFSPELLVEPYHGMFLKGGGKE
jgi:SWI/SNF-related matrix-associated actin-dependent regulator of chromatin subfamily A containing DEAD/H box 1